MSKQAWANLRLKRDEELRKTDYTQLADAPVSSKEKKFYRDYREYLRNLPLCYNSETILKYKIMSYDEWLKKNRLGKYQ
jgi:hypothetical protein